MKFFEAMEAVMGGNKVRRADWKDQLYVEVHGTVPWIFDMDTPVCQVLITVANAETDDWEIVEETPSFGLTDIRIWVNEVVDAFQEQYSGHDLRIYSEKDWKDHFTFWLLNAD